MEFDDDVDSLACACLSWLLDAGANVHARDRDARTPLHIAASHGCMLGIERLVAAGADTDAVDRDGSTPLIAALQCGHDHRALGKVRALLLAGAAPEATNLRGDRASTFAWADPPEEGPEWGAGDFQRRGLLDDQLEELMQEHVLKKKEVAFAMAWHPRLGAGSEARGLDPEMVEMVWGFVPRQEEGAAEGGGRASVDDWASWASDDSDEVGDAQYFRR